GPETSEKAQDSEVRVGFDRVANQRPLRRKGLGEAPILRSEGGCRIEIERGAYGHRDLRDRDPFGLQLAAAITEEITHSDKGVGKLPARPGAAPAVPSCRTPSNRMVTTRNKSAR